MILSVSRRTDIPAFYTTWFMERLREGFVMVRNPMNYHQISKVLLSPELVDCIVFWTKNAAPLLPHIDEITAKYPCYFQYTLNAYERDVEANTPPLIHKVETFINLSKKLGSNKVIWRYDPIAISEKYSVAWHIARFAELAEKLAGYTNTCVFSFMDIYPKIKKNVEELRSCTTEEMETLAVAFAEIAHKHGMELRTCAEMIDLERYGIKHNCCIDAKLIESLIGYELNVKKDANQRMECGCVESVDIGQYNTCRHGCRYCYANFNHQSVITFSKQHDPKSPLLIGQLDPGDKITERKMKSLKGNRLVEGEQLSLFD